MSQITLTQMWKEYDEDSIGDDSESTFDNVNPKIGYDTFVSNDDKEQITLTHMWKDYKIV